MAEKLLAATSSSATAALSLPSISHPKIPGTSLSSANTALPRHAKGARLTCVFGGEKRDAARQALESALGEKKEAFSKWDEEIKKREASGGGGGKGRGRGWGGGGGGGGDRGEDSSPDESGSTRSGELLQVVYAFGGLTALYFVLTQGGSMLAFILNSILYVSRGFKPRPAPRYAPADSGDAESHVRNKWGSDE